MIRHIQYFYLPPHFFLQIVFSCISFLDSDRLPLHPFHASLVANTRTFTRKLSHTHSQKKKKRHENAFQRSKIPLARSNNPLLAIAWVKALTTAYLSFGLSRTWNKTTYFSEVLIDFYRIHSKTTLTVPLVIIDGYISRAKEYQ